MALSKAVIAVIVIVILAIAGFGAYNLSQSAATTTVTTTVTQGAATLTTTVGGTTVTTTVSGAANISQTLADQCKAEGGAVTAYAVMDSTDWPTMNNVLIQSFPWIKVNYVGLSPSDIYTKGAAEYQAHHVQADVFQDTTAPIIQLEQAGALQPYKNYIEPFMNYSSEQVDASNYWHPVNQIPMVLMYNTNLVKDNTTLPNSWTDLANPQWKGKISIDNPNLLNVAGLLFASLEPSMGNASWTQFLQGVKANDPILTQSAGDAYTNVASGQAALGIGLLNDYIGGIGKAPVAIKIFNPTYVLTAPIALANGAPHPACGELFIQWFTSYMGQYSLTLTGRAPVMPLVASQYLGAYIPAGTRMVPGASGAPTYYSDTAGWSSYYTSIFGS